MSFAPFPIRVRPEVKSWMFQSLCLLPPSIHGVILPMSFSHRNTVSSYTESHRSCLSPSFVPVVRSVRCERLESSRPGVDTPSLMLIPITDRHGVPAFRVVPQRYGRVCQFCQRRRRVRSSDAASIRGHRLRSTTTVGRVMHLPRVPHQACMSR